MRQRDIGARPSQMNGMRRFATALSLAMSVVLIMLAPFVTSPVAAAPPETAEAEETATTSGATGEAGPEAESPADTQEPGLLEPENSPLADAAPDDRERDDGSIRLRGLEAPVQLEQQDARGADQPGDAKKAARSEDKEPDPGDGPVRKRQDARNRNRGENRERRDTRVWPMPAESYTFTQEFGCVPQLGNLYFPGAGCPADAPVIHTGIDLAAPEGTPFYAAASGWVTLSDFDRPTADANTRIIIQHDGRNEGYATDYLHWIASYVEEGDYVHAGDPIGEVGSVGYSTGPHLHFSVTDLDTGEHIDPLRWLPDEPGLEGYVSRMPRAQMRLPAGTTAGQPESADPAPPPPPEKEEVPESPGDGKRGDSSERRSERKRDERRGETNGDSATNDGKQENKKRSRDNANAETSDDESTSDAEKDRNRSRDRERTRERNDDDAESDDAASGDDSEERNNRDDSGNGDRRKNRDANKDEGEDGSGAEDSNAKEEPDNERGGRADRDNDRDKTSGRDKQGGQNERPGDRRNADQDKSKSGGEGNRDRRRKS